MNGACYLYREIECRVEGSCNWELFNYSEWRNFYKVIEKAKVACQNAGERILDHFVDSNKMIGLAKGAQREVEDVALTRYACYLIAQNGDAVKDEIAFAQTYFAVQTRKQEIIEQRLLDVARVTAREKLSRSEKKLSGIIYQRGVDHRGFALIRSKGDHALFGGFATNEMKKRLRVPESKPLADFLPTLVIKAKDFATELTGHNVVEKDLKGQTPILKEHVDNNKAVRKMLQGRGIKPEFLPPDEDVTKLKRRLQTEGKKVLKQVKQGRTLKNSKKK